MKWSGALSWDQYKAELSSLEERASVDEVLRARKQNDHEQKRLDGLQTSLEEQERELARLQARFHEWGLFMDPSIHGTVTQLAVSPQQLHKNLEDQGLEYSKDTVAELLAALDTHMLVILSGPPGHGKTRLVKELGKLPGVTLEVVPVRPSWHDPADLLGYQNPLAPELAPVTTKFAEALLRAEAYPDELHIVLLDELNLAPVEHYMADFLSLIEERSRGTNLSDSKVRVPLRYRWPKPDAIKDADDSVASTDPVVQAVLERLRRDRSLMGDSVTLPPNLRLVGTVNIDATVESLSPRVVDRSVVIQVGAREADLEAPDPELSDVQLSLSPLGDLPSWRGDSTEDPQLLEAVQARLEQVREGLRGLGWGVQLSPRRWRQAALMAGSLAKVYADGTADRSAVIADAIVRTLVLPRLMEVDAARARKGLTDLETALEQSQCRLALAELKALRNRSEHTLSYWVY